MNNEKSNEDVPAGIVALAHKTLHPSPTEFKGHIGDYNRWITQRFRENYFVYTISVDGKEWSVGENIRIEGSKDNLPILFQGEIRKFTFENSGIWTANFYNGAAYPVSRFAKLPFHLPQGPVDEAREGITKDETIHRLCQRADSLSFQIQIRDKEIASLKANTGMEWVKASERLPAAPGKNRHKINVKYRGSADVIQYINGIWYWLHEGKSTQYPVIDELWEAIQWLDESKLFPGMGWPTDEEIDRGLSSETAQRWPFIIWREAIKWVKTRLEPPLDSEQPEKR